MKVTSCSFSTYICQDKMSPLTAAEENQQKSNHTNVDHFRIYILVVSRHTLVLFGRINEDLIVNKDVGLLFFLSVPALNSFKKLTEFGFSV